MRPDKDTYFLNMAKLVSTRSTCMRRHVGVVAINSRGHVLATGMNGVPSGFEHCNEGHQCPGARAETGTRLDDCWAVHAEVNLLAQCPDVWKIDTIYMTVSPCVSCTKALLSTSCRRLVFLEEYAHGGSRHLWVDLGKREWILRPLP